jgi:hypothetical protein
MVSGYRSSGDAMSAGLEGGVRLATGIMDRERRIAREDKEDALRAEDRATAKADRERRITREDSEVERQQTADAATALENEEKGLAGEFEGLYREFGGDETKIPADRKQALMQRRVELARRRREVNERRYRPVLEARQKRATDLIGSIKSGKVKVEDVPDEELYDALGVALRRDPAELLRGPDGQVPSKLGEAIQGLLAGIEQSDPQQLVPAVNTILAPELAQGVGQPGRDGSTIIKKEVERLLPAPNDPGRLVPVLRVHVRRADGATGSYLAPITAGRSADGDDDEVVTLPMDRAMDYVGQLGTLEEIVNSPIVRAKIERGAARGKVELGSFLDAYHASGAKPFKRKVKAENVNLGDRTLRITSDEDTGKEIDREEFERGIDPTREYVADTAAEAGIARTRITQAGASQRAAARTAAGSVNIENELRRADEAGQTAAARDLGMVRRADPISGRPKWVTTDEKGKEREPTTRELSAIENAGRRAREDKRKALHAAGRTPEAAAADRAPPGGAPAPAPAAQPAMTPELKKQMNDARLRNGLPALP